MTKYDIGFIFCGDKKESILKWLHEECRLRGLSFVWINQNNAEAVLQKILSHKIKVNFLVDNESNYYNPEDIFLKLCYAVKDNGGRIIDDPDAARSSADKSITHFDFVDAELPVPYTVVVRNWQPDDFEITKEQFRKLGKPFIIKPATGFGQKGVVKDASGDIKQIAEARHFNRGDNFLLQEKIIPEMLGGHMGWFRVYYLFGEIIPCFWNTETGEYRHVSLREMYKFRLLPLARIVSEIARVVNMKFFSSEIAVTGKGKERRFVIIDYVNDQCELCVRPTKIGGPVPEVVRHVAEIMAEHGWMHKIGKKPMIHRAIWLAKAQTEDETI
ncbi:RimK family alpha-L-glutamate ligase [Candidatus Margulisiibacteriota bacterium]